MNAATAQIIDLTGQTIDLRSWTGWAQWWEAGLDMGSGITTVYIQPAKAVSKDRTERGPIYRLSLPSVVDTGEKSLERIANGRQAPRSRPASALRAGEFVLRSENDQNRQSRLEHLVGSLANLEGVHPTDAKGASNRYWGEHIRIIAQTVFGAIIPDIHAEIRMNFCMPYSLFTPANKELAAGNLDGVYACYINEIYRQLDIRVGTVVPEGFAAITRHGSPMGKNCAIDIGDRTTEIIFAKGPMLVSRDSKGKPYGVRQLIEAIQRELSEDYGRSLDTEETRILLKAYTAGQPLPRLRVSKGSNDGYLDSQAQYEIISRKIVPIARALATFIRSTLNQEGAEIGSDLDTATIYGGGAYIFHQSLKEGIPDDPELGEGVLKDLILPPEPEYLNASYMLELVGTLSQVQPDIWARKR